MPEEKITELEKLIEKAQLQPGLKEIFELYSKFEDVRIMSDSYQQIMFPENIAFTSNNSGGYIVYQCNYPKE